MKMTELGVQFPLNDGRRSTTQASRDVLSAAAAAVDSDLAETIRAEKDWRSRYPAHLRALTARAAASTEAARRIARAGLERLHQRFVLVDDDGDRPLLDGVEATPQVRLSTREVKGEGDGAHELVVPYKGKDLRGEQIIAQARDWAERGVVEAGFVAAIARVVAHPEWLDLSGRTFALLGAGAEMGPTEHLLTWGADVVAVDIPRPRIWERLEELARTGSGTLQVPVRPDGSDGADLIAEPATVRAWLESFDRPLLVGNYAYADGADFVRVAMAADAIITVLQRRLDEVALAYLATPTDVFAVPPDAVAMARDRQRAGVLGGALPRLARTVTRGRAFVPNYRLTVTSEDGRELGIADSLVLQQGPNYALAKRLQRWRAVVARQDGYFSAVHVAPATLTRSVTKNRILAAAYAGAHVFEVEAFEPATSRAIMSALLVHDLHHAGAAANPVGEHNEHEHDLTREAAHGGLWRVAWEPRSALPVAVAVGARKLVLPT
jgi:hypothetical protein